MNSQEVRAPALRDTSEHRGQAGPLLRRQRLGNPLTTGNVAHEKSRIRFLGVRGGIFLKMLFWENI